jgi:co-chaperonin GroES (HSP10)
MLQALRNEVIVKPIYVKQQGLIVIPQGALKFKQYDAEVYGLVESVGPRYPYELKAGDLIIFERHEGTRIKYQGENYLRLKAIRPTAIINNG